MTAVENEQAPPSSAEEAAALLGAAISFDATSYNVNSSSSSSAPSSPTAATNGNPPQGMHSIFTVQTPVPNQILFIRLINLRAWLRWHAGIDSELGISFPPHIKPPKRTNSHHFKQHAASSPCCRNYSKSLRLLLPRGALVHTAMMAVCRR